MIDVLIYLNSFDLDYLFVFLLLGLIYIDYVMFLGRFIVIEMLILMGFVNFFRMLNGM